MKGASLAGYWRTLVLVGLALAFWAGAGPAPGDWVLDRSAVAAGEWWRFVTGHWVHADARHAAWDIAGLAALGVIFERRLGNRFLVTLAAATLAVDAWFWWAAPGLERYCGLSGILNGLLAAGLVDLWRERRDPLVLVIGLLAGAKISLEVAAGSALLTATAWPSVPVAHGAGALAGLALAVCWPRHRSSPSSAPNGPGGLRPPVSGPTVTALTTGTSGR